jgi:hypothetical protein
MGAAILRGDHVAIAVTGTCRGSGAGSAILMSVLSSR